MRQLPFSPFSNHRTPLRKHNRCTFVPQYQYDSCGTMNVVANEGTHSARDFSSLFRAARNALPVQDRIMRNQLSCRKVLSSFLFGVISTGRAELNCAGDVELDRIALSKFLSKSCNSLTPSRPRARDKCNVHI